MTRKRSSPFLKSLYLTCAQEFSDVLGPLPTNTIVRWGKRWEMTEKKGKKRYSLWGYHALGSNPPEIVISEELKDREKLFARGVIIPSLKGLLAHEMLHLAVGEREVAHHGKLFKMLARGLIQRGMLEV